MEKIKKYIKPIIKWAILLLIYFFSLVTVGYTGFLKLSTISNLNLIVISIVLFLIGINKGRKTSKKGFLEGLKLGCIFTIVLLILNLIFFRNFSLNIFLYYVLTIVSPTLGGIIGINLKR